MALLISTSPFESMASFVVLPPLLPVAIKKESSLISSLSPLPILHLSVPADLNLITPLLFASALISR